MDATVGPNEYACKYIPHMGICQIPHGGIAINCMTPSVLAGIGVPASGGERIPAPLTCL
jgi:hypothetical protein